MRHCQLCSVSNSYQTGQRPTGPVRVAADVVRKGDPRPPGCQATLTARPLRMIGDPPAALRATPLYAAG